MPDLYRKVYLRMSICDDLKNDYFIGKLIGKIGEDVILFGFDGMSYYGRLMEISEDHIGLLTPAALSSTYLVEIQNPAEVAAVENRVYILLDYLVGFGYDITADPFVIPDDNAEDVTGEGAQAPPSAAPASGFGGDCGQSGLVDKLKAMALLTVGTLGGFLFAGYVSEVQEDTATMGIVYIFAPGGDGSTLFSINNAVVNLKAASSVAS